jgi:hypothetical protein
MNPVQDGLPHSFTNPVEEIHRFRLHANQNPGVAPTIIPIRRAGQVHYRETGSVSRRDFDWKDLKTAVLSHVRQFLRKLSLPSAPPAGNSE